MNGLADDKTSIDQQKPPLVVSLLTVITERYVSATLLFLSVLRSLCPVCLTFELMPSLNECLILKN